MQLAPVKELFEELRGSRDELNQYSFSFGLPELRQAIADYTQTCYGYRPDPEEQITVVLGSQRGHWPPRSAPCSNRRRRGGDAALRRAVPVAGGDLRTGALFRDLARRSPRRNLAAGPRRAAGRPVRSGGQGGGREHPAEPDRQGAGRGGPGIHRRALPTHDRFAITDEIYEHITFDGHRHHCLALCEGMAERTWW